LLSLFSNDFSRTFFLAREEVFFPETQRGEIGHSKDILHPVRMLRKNIIVGSLVLVFFTIIFAYPDNEFGIEIEIISGSGEEILNQAEYQDFMKVILLLLFLFSKY
jgi:hypothetical protein